MDLLTFVQAERIAKAAVASARAGNKNPCGIAVIDHTANCKYVMREDGANLAAAEIAAGKARAALTFGCTSAQIADALSGNALAGPSVLGVIEKRIVLLGGGVLIKDRQGITIGAIGVSGGAPADDEAIALSGTAAL